MNSTTSRRKLPEDLERARRRARLSALRSAVVVGARRARPPPSSASWTAAQALQAIREGRVSAEAYVNTLLARAELLVGPQRADRAEQGRRDRCGAPHRCDAQCGQRAAAARGRCRSSSRTTSTRATCRRPRGTTALRNVRPSVNAPTLQRLIDAGAIVLGKANMHELAFGITSTNLTSFAGPVKNPYDQTRIPGGSSGGTAAAIAARIVPAGLGTDTGGSTRMPAALTGTVGLRPSVGNGGAERRYDGAGGGADQPHARHRRADGTHRGRRRAARCCDHEQPRRQRRRV